MMVNMATDSEVSSLGSDLRLHWHWQHLRSTVTEDAVNLNPRELGLRLRPASLRRKRTCQVGVFVSDQLLALSSSVSAAGRSLASRMIRIAGLVLGATERAPVHRLDLDRDCALASKCQAGGSLY